MELTSDLVGDFIDAVVLDQLKAERLLVQWPQLKSARWLNDESLVHFFTTEGYNDGVRWLLEHGFDTNVVSEIGETALMAAVLTANLDLAKLLVDFGADVNIESRALGSLLDIAILADNPEILNFVRVLLDQHDGPEVG